MKTILKNIMLFAAGALTLGFTACEEDGQDLNFNIQPGQRALRPRGQRIGQPGSGFEYQFRMGPLRCRRRRIHHLRSVVRQSGRRFLGTACHQDQPDDRLQSFAEHLGQRVERSGRPGGHRECQDRADQMDGTCRQRSLLPNLHAGQCAHRFTYQSGRSAADGRHAEG